MTTRLKRIWRVVHCFARRSGSEPARTHPVPRPLQPDVAILLGLVITFSGLALPMPGPRWSVESRPRLRQLASYGDGRQQDAGEASRTFRILGDT
jgi:hypothetical protein